MALGLERVVDHGTAPLRVLPRLLMAIVAAAVRAGRYEPGMDCGVGRVRAARETDAAGKMDRRGRGHRVHDMGIGAAWGRLRCTSRAKKVDVAVLQKCCKAAIIEEPMKTTLTITSRGVVTLPAKLRQAMGLKAD